MIRESITDIADGVLDADNTAVMWRVLARPGIVTRRTRRIPWTPLRIAAELLFIPPLSIAVGAAAFSLVMVSTVSAAIVADGAPARLLSGLFGLVRNITLLPCVLAVVLWRFLVGLHRAWKGTPARDHLAERLARVNRTEDEDPRPHQVYRPRERLAKPVFPERNTGSVRYMALHPTP
jgi:hypothetical protein